MKQLSVARHAGKELEVLPRSGVWAVHLLLHHILHLRNGANNSRVPQGQSWIMGACTAFVNGQPLSPWALGTAPAGHPWM